MIGLNITVFVTMQCNLRCTYCYEKSEERMSVMSLETADKIVNFIVNKIKALGAKKLSVRFHGGEPLIAFDKIDYLVNRLDVTCSQMVDSIQYTMTTNFTLYNSIMAATLKKFSSIFVSIDGTEQSHDLNRRYIDGSGSYLDVEHNVNNAILDGLHIMGRLTLTKQNYQDVDVNVKSIIHMGIDVVDIELDLVEKQWMYIDIDLYIKKIRNIIDYCTFLKNTQDRDVRVPMFTHAANRPKNTLCDGGISSFAIMPNGLIYPCTSAVNNKKYLLGDLDGNINEKVLELLHEVGEQSVEECRGCTRYEYCATTRCKIINEVYTGNYNKVMPSVCLTENIDVKIGKLYRQILNN